MVAVITLLGLLPLLAAWAGVSPTTSPMPAKAAAAAPVNPTWRRKLLRPLGA
jgi:hypothetical protein